MHVEGFLFRRGAYLFLYAFTELLPDRAVAAHRMITRVGSKVIY